MNKHRLDVVLLWILIFISLAALILKLAGIGFLNYTYVFGGIIVFWIAYFIIFREIISEKMKIIAKKYHFFFSVCQDSFNYLLIAYLILLLCQEFNYLKHIEANYLLAVVILTGVITVLFPVEKKEEQKEIKLMDHLLIWFLGTLGLVLIYIKTEQLGWLSYVISAIAGVLIVLLGYLVYEKDEEEEEFQFTKKNLKLTIGLVVIGLVILSFVVGYFNGMMQGFRIVFGSVYVLFLPGLIVSFLFFAGKEIDILERIALSFALSIAVVPLVVFYLNLTGLIINAVNVSLVILAICLIGLIGIKIKSKVSR